MQMATEAAAGTTTTPSTTRLAAATSPKVAYSRNKKTGSYSGPSSQDGLNKSIEDTAFEIKTRKDQGSSTSSPVKVSKMIHFQPSLSLKQPKNSNHDWRELNSLEFEQFQQQQSALEQLKAHNKRHGLVLQNPDTSFEKLIGTDIGKQTERKNSSKDTEVPPGKDEISHKDERTPKMLIHQHKNGQTKDKVSDSAWNKSVLSFCKKKEPKQKQGQLDIKEEATKKGIQYSKGGLDKCVGNDGNICTQCRTDKTEQCGKAAVEQALSAKQDRVTTERLQNQSRSGAAQSISQPKIHHLCQQCQNCQAGKKDKLHLKNKMKDIESRPNQVVWKQGDSSHSGGNSGFRETKSKYPVTNTLLGGKNVNTSTIERNVHQNDLSNEKKNMFLTEKVSQFPGTTDPADSSLIECLKPCADAIKSYEGARHETVSGVHIMDCKDLKKRRDYAAGKQPQCPLTPVHEEHHSPQQPVSHSLKQQPESVNRYSVGSVPPGSELCSPSQDSEPDSVTTLSQGDKKTTGSVTQRNKPLFRISSKAFDSGLNSSLKSNHPPVIISMSKACGDMSCSRDSLSSDKVDSHIRGQINALTSLSSHDCQGSAVVSQPPRFDEKMRPKSSPSGEGNEVSLDENTEHSSKLYSYEDKEYFEDKYRLYYDEDLSSCNGQNLPADSKGIVTPSKPSIWNMKQNSSMHDSQDNQQIKKCARGNDKMRLLEPFAPQMLDSTHDTLLAERASSSPKETISGTKVSTSNQEMPLRSPDVSPVTHTSWASCSHSDTIANFNTSSDKFVDSITSSKNLSPVSLQGSSSMITGNLCSMSVNSTANDSSSKDKSGTSVASREITTNSSSQSSQISAEFTDIRKLPDQTESNGMKNHCSVNGHLSTDMLSGAGGGKAISGLEARAHPVAQGILYPTKNVIYDESCSYKPKYPQPALNLQIANSEPSQNSGSSQNERSIEVGNEETAVKQISPPFRPAPYSNDCKQDYKLTLQNRKSMPTFHHNPASYTSSSTDVKREPHHHQSGYRVYSQSVSQTCGSLANGSMHNSQTGRECFQQDKNGYRPYQQHLRPGSYPQSQNSDPFCDDPSSFLRTSSPHHFFSVLPYREYVLSTAGTENTAVLASDADRSSTPTSSKSSSKVKSEGKCKKSSSCNSKSRKMHGCDGVQAVQPQCVAENPCLLHMTAYDGKRNVPRNVRRQRHSDGVILKAHDKNYYPLHFPRYSLESNSLISSAFLQKMSYLPQYQNQPHSQAQENESHAHSSSQSARQTKVHAELMKKSQMSIFEEPKQKSQVSQKSKGVSAVAMTGASPSRLSPNPAVPETPPNVSFDDSNNTAGASCSPPQNVQPTPDLLPVNDSVKEKSSSAKKAQSFFSRLTHSPMSFFQKDSKSTQPPK